jgi:hypothetical protein
MGVGSSTGAGCGEPLVGEGDRDEGLCIENWSGSGSDVVMVSVSQGTNGGVEVLADRVDVAGVDMSGSFLLTDGFGED